MSSQPPAITTYKQLSSSSTVPINKYQTRIKKILTTKPTRCTISQIYFDKELYMFRTDLLSIIRGLNTVFTAIGVCHIGYVDCSADSASCCFTIIRNYHDARSSECQNISDVNVRSYVIKRHIPRHFKSDVIYHTTPRITTESTKSDH